MARNSDKKTLQESFSALRRINRWAAAVQAAQGIVLLVLAKRAEQIITTNFVTTDTVQSAVAGHTVLAPATHQLWTVNAGYIVAVCFFVSALVHFVAATFKRNCYESDLKKNTNRFRWADFAVSNSLMLVAVALFAGVYDFSTLAAVFFLFATMSGFWLLAETLGQGKKRLSQLPFWFGAAGGAVALAVVGFYLWSSNIWGSGHIAAFVYWIFGTVLVGTVLFAVSVWLAARRQGRWSDYLFAERVFIVLGVVAQAAVAWQIYAGALKP